MDEGCSWTNDSCYHGFSFDEPFRYNNCFSKGHLEEDNKEAVQGVHHRGAYYNCHGVGFPVGRRAERRRERKDSSDNR